MSNTNLTTSAGLSPTMQKFYDRNLLENAKTRFVHAKFGQKRPIPRNNGKTIEMRRWDLFPPNTTPLQEGVTPAGQYLGQTTVEAAVKQYGAYVEVSDFLDLTAVDNVITDSTELLGEQLGTTIEWITRDAMNATTNVQYAGGVAARNLVEGKLSVAEIRKAVRTLKKNKARMFTDGKRPHFVCICSPDATYDLQDDNLWQDVSKYSNAEQIYSGEIGRLFGVVFVESTEAKVYEQAVLNAVYAATTDSATFVLKNDPTEAEAAYLSVAGNAIMIGTTEHTIASFNASTKTVTLSAVATLTKDAVVWTDDAGKANATTKVAPPIHSTLIFGKDAYGVVDVAGSGAVKSIIKPHGSAGAADPLDQRATVGAKVMAYTAKVLNDLWILAIEHTVSA